MVNDTRSYTLLRQFFTDLGTIPSLSSSEEEALLTRLRLASQEQLTPEQASQAKQRLIEGYMRRVVTLARVCDRQYRVVTFADLIQEGCLALIQTIDKCACQPLSGTLSAYVSTIVRYACLQALERDAPVQVPRASWHAIRKAGREDDYAWIGQTVSLDALLNEEGERLSDTLVAPSREQEAAVREARRIQLDGLLAAARLTERQRQVLALRYGLGPTDAREHSVNETARLLGITRWAVTDAELRALGILRQLAQEQEQAGLAHPRSQGNEATPCAREDTPAARLERLLLASHDLEQQGVCMGVRRLSRLARVSERQARAFFATQQGDEAQRLQRTWTYLTGEHLPITLALLARVARVSESDAQAFVAACSHPAEMLVAAS